MRKSPTSHAEVITALGGYRSVAEALGGIPATTVFYWTRPDRGIPSHRWGDIAALAKRKRVRGVTVERLSETKPGRKGACAA